MRFDIPESELNWRFSTSGGPGGQQANRTSTRAELTFVIADSSVFGTEMRERLRDRLGDEVRIREGSSRSQMTNRKRAIRRLNAVLDDASHPEPPERRLTKPSRAARRSRVDEKRAHGITKKLRRRPEVSG